MQISVVVLLRFIESKFASNHIFISLKTMLISFCSFVVFGLFITILVSSANRTEVALFSATLSKSLM